MRTRRDVHGVQGKEGHPQSGGTRCVSVELGAGSCSVSGRVRREVPRVPV